MEGMGPTEKLLLSMSRSVISEYRKNKDVMKRKLEAFSRMNSASWNSAEYNAAKKEAISALNLQLIAYQDYRNFMSRIRPIWKRIKERLEEAKSSGRVQYYETRDLELTDFIIEDLHRLLHPGWLRSGMLELIERQIIYLSDDDVHRFDVYFKKEMRLLYGLSKKIGFDSRLTLPTDIMMRLREESNSFARRSMLGMALLIAAVAINFCEVNKIYAMKNSPAAHSPTNIQHCFEETARWSEHLIIDMVKDEFPHTPLVHEKEKIMIDDRTPPNIGRSI